MAKIPQLKAKKDTSRKDENGRQKWTKQLIEQGVESSRESRKAKQCEYSEIRIMLRNN